MIKGFQTASLRALLAVIVAVAGLSGLVASTSAQIDGDVWTSIHVELPDGPGNVGVSWAIDDANVGGAEARVAEGQDFYDLPDWIIQANLAEGTYWLTLSVTGYEVIQEQFVVDESTATFGDYWYLNLSYTLMPAQGPGPLPLALVYLDVSSSDPAAANTLPAGATWVISDNSGAGHGVISSGEFTELELPIVVEVPEGVPFGQMLVSIDGLPAFEAYERTHDVENDEESFDIVLDPVAGEEDDNGDDGQNGDDDDADDGRNGTDADNGDDGRTGDDAADTNDKDEQKDSDEKAEDVKALPVVGSGTSTPGGSGLYTILALVAAIVAVGAGLRLRATTT